MSSPTSFSDEYCRMNSTSYAQEDGTMVLYDDGSGEVVEYDLITSSSTLDMEADVYQFLREKKASIGENRARPVSIHSPDRSAQYVKTDYDLQQADNDMDIENRLPGRTRKQCNQSTIIYTRVPDRWVVPRARASLPAALQLVGERVVTRRRLPAYALFGPVQGVCSEVSAAEAVGLKHVAEVEGRVIFLIADSERRTTVHIDVSDENTSNWLRYVPLGAPGAVSLRLQQVGRELCAVSVRALPRGAPLTLAYSPAYLAAHFPHESASCEDGVEARKATTAVTTGSDADWQCYECAALCHTSAELQDHLTMHDPPTVVEGGKAGRGLPRGRRKLPRCPYCVRAFTKPSYLKKHMLSHQHPSPPTLTLDETPTSVSNLDGAPPAAPARGRCRGRGRLACALCPATARTRSRHRAHTDTHRAADALFHCTRCSKTFETYPTVRQHMRAQHDAARYACPRCSATFTRASAYNSHMLRYTDERKFICECGKQFKRKDKLRAHMLAKHTNGIVEQTKSPAKKDISGMPYVCRLCRIAFKRRGMLLNHVVRRHPELSPGALPELARPMMRPRRDYPCPRCPRVYSVAVKRKEHFLRHHPGESPPASRGAGAGVRERAPATAVPHACPAPACHRQYATRGRLNRHLREAHPLPAAGTAAVEMAAEAPAPHRGAPTILLLADIAADQSAALLCPQWCGAAEQLPCGDVLAPPPPPPLSGAETYAAEALAYLLHRPHSLPPPPPPPPTSPPPSDLHASGDFDACPKLATSVVFNFTPNEQE